MKRAHPYLGGFLIAAIAGLLTLVPLSAANAQKFSDAEIKAVYIYKLGKFVSWDGKKHAPIQFCYAESSRTEADTSVGRNLEKLVSSKNLGNEWQVERLRGVDGIGKCDILFISETEESAVASIVSKAGAEDVLTISDIKRFIYKEGMIGFVLDDENRVKMEANLKNIRKTKVQVSAQVLEFMTQVIK